MLKCSPLHQYSGDATVNLGLEMRACEGPIPRVHGQRRHVHLVLGLERVVACCDVMQRQRTERAAESEQRQRGRVALETLTLQRSDLPADLQRLPHRQSSRIQFKPGCSLSNVVCLASPTSAVFSNLSPSSPCKVILAAQISTVSIWKQNILL